MKAVVQRCYSAAVVVDGATIGKINQGLLVLVGVGQTDTNESAALLAQKISKLRIFCDEEDKMNRSVLDCKGGVLAVSNFTLMANTKKGNRPSFDPAMEPNEANRLYEYFCHCLKELGVLVQTGVFGADMKILLEGDGPVTVCLDTDQWIKPPQ